MLELLQEIKKCTVCSEHLDFGPRPIISGSASSKLVIIGQAPGSVVHNTGIHWDDNSGDNLRQWLGMDNTVFYDAENVELVPMGFCYPGKGKSGDLPPRKECAPLWHERVTKALGQVQLTLLIGSYAQAYYLGNRREGSLTATVQNFEKYLPEYFVLPHPSPRNNIWQAKNPWFKKKGVAKDQRRSRIIGFNGQ